MESDLMEQKMKNDIFPIDLNQIKIEPQDIQVENKEDTKQCRNLQSKDSIGHENHAYVKFEIEPIDHIIPSVKTESEEDADTVLVSQNVHLNDFPKDSEADSSSFSENKQFSLAKCEINLGKESESISAFINSENLRTKKFRFTKLKKVCGLEDIYSRKFVQRYCDICNKSFSESYIKRHKRIHTGERPYTCEVCRKCFNCKSHLNTHMRIHTGYRPHVCVMCSKSFANSSNFRKHMRLHLGERPYPCHVCNKSFSAKGDLDRHRRGHSGTRPFVCDICKQSFTLKNVLKNHIRKHTAEQAYVCEICSKSFSRKNILVKHRSIHTGNRPHICGLCNKSFSQKKDLDNHVRIHGGERPYSCNLCNKAFKKRDILNNHKLTHARIHAFSCETCNKTFSSENGDYSSRVCLHMKDHSYVYFA